MRPRAQRRVARRSGLHNVGPMWRAARRAAVPFYVACALFEKESKGLNIYGHDKGGALSTNGQAVSVEGREWPPGSDIPVTPANAGVFLLIVGSGATSNGMGPAQITYAKPLPDGSVGGYFRQMLERGLLPWDPEDNMAFGLEILRGHYVRTHSWSRAGAAYSGRESYGADLARLIEVWRDRLA